jgi:hypothetical protein
MAAPMSGYDLGPEYYDTPIAQVPLPEEYFEYEFQDDASMKGTELPQKEKFTDSTGMLLLFFRLFVFKCGSKTHLKKSLTTQCCMTFATAGILVQAEKSANFGA